MVGVTEQKGLVSPVGMVILDINAQLLILKIVKIIIIMLQVENACLAKLDFMETSVCGHVQMGV